MISAIGSLGTETTLGDIQTAAEALSSALPLPTGASTESTLTDVKTATEAISGIIAGGKIPTTASPATADAEPDAARTNPPAPIAGEDYGSGCDAGPCIEIPKVDSSGNLYTLTALATANGAEGAAPTNPPVPVASRADSTEPTAVDDGDSKIPFTDLVGRTITKGFCTPGNEVWDYVNITNSTETEVLAGAGSSTYMYITFLSVIGVGTTATEIIFYDDDACDGGGTALFGGYVSDTPPSGFIIGDGDQPVLKVTTANQKFCVKAVTTGADIHITTKGCKSTQ